MTESNGEQRRFHRILFDAPCILSDSSFEWHSFVIDLSLNGALITLPENWTDTPAGEIQLTVQLNDTDEKITMKVLIVHSTNENIGLERVEIDADSATHLRRLVELNLGDMALLERDLSAMLH